MDILFSTPSRQFNNTTYDTGDLQLSKFVDIPSNAGVLVHFEVETMTAGASILLTYSITTGGVYMGGESFTLTAPGRISIGFDRGDIDSTTIVKVVMQFMGRSRINAVVYAIIQGEDVPEWL